MVFVDMNRSKAAINKAEVGRVAAALVLVLGTFIVASILGLCFIETKRAEAKALAKKTQQDAIVAEAKEKLLEETKVKLFKEEGPVLLERARGILVQELKAKILEEEKAKILEEEKAKILEVEKKVQDEEKVRPKQ